MRNKDVEDGEWMSFQCENLGEMLGAILWWNALREGMCYMEGREMMIHEWQ